MTDRPLTSAELNAMFDATDNAALAREEAELRREERAANTEHDELARHLDWSFWGTGMADTFREHLAATMLAAITPEQRQQANDLITRWRDHREFVGRDKYEEQAAEIAVLRSQLAASRDQVLAEGAEMLRHAPVGRHETDGIDRAADLLDAARAGQEPAAPAAAEPEFVCGVCEDLDCGHCLECGCQACDEARKYAETLASAEQQVLAAARARVEALPTANQGQLIAATREQILDAITRTDDQEH